MEDTRERLWPWPLTEDEKSYTDEPVCTYGKQYISKIEDFFIERYVVISKFPGSRYDVGDIILGPKFEFDMQKYPSLFKKLEWYERRDISDLMKIKFVMVNKNSYYTAGDFVPVYGYDIDARNPTPKFLTFWVGDSKSHPFNLEHVIPATEEEYEAYEVLRKNGSNRM